MLFSPAQGKGRLSLSIWLFRFLLATKNISHTHALKYPRISAGQTFLRIHPFLLSGSYPGASGHGLRGWPRPGMQKLYLPVSVTLPTKPSWALTPSFPYLLASSPEEASRSELRMRERSPIHVTVFSEFPSPQLAI